MEQELQSNQRSISAKISAFKAIQRVILSGAKDLPKARASHYLFSVIFASTVRFLACARNVDHRAHFHLATFLLANFASAFVQDSFGVTQFLQTGNHREHDLDVPDCART